MLLPTIFTLVTIVLYVAATSFGIGGMLTRKGLGCRIGGWLALGAFACQTALLIGGIHKALPGGLSAGAYLQLLAWFFLLCGVLAWWRLKKDILILFAAPLALILFLMSAPWLNMAVALPPSLTAPFYALHIGSLFLSLGLLALAFMAALFFIFMQNRIKSKKNVKGIWQDMPAISMLDKINAVCVIMAFPLYTIGLLAGLFWAKSVFDGAHGDPKEIISLFVWCLLALLFNNRISRRWVGRKPALLTILIFALSCFSIIIVNIFLPTYHAFMRS